MKPYSIWKDTLFVMLAGLAFVIILMAVGVAQGCTSPPDRPVNPRLKFRKVVKIGECYESWNYGCKMCGVQYDDGRGGRECEPIVGAKYPVGDDE